MGISLKNINIKSHEKSIRKLFQAIGELFVFCIVLNNCFGLKMCIGQTTKNVNSTNMIGLRKIEILTKTWSKDMKGIDKGLMKINEFAKEVEKIYTFFCFNYEL